MPYYSPIINQRLKGDESEPYIATQENLTIKNQKVQLSGVPDYLTHVYIDGMNEIYNGLPKENEFIVDYKYGYVTFNLANDNQNINVSYNSTGCSFFPANRVYTQQIDGEIVETLDGVIQSAQTAINGLEQLDIVIEDAIQTTNDVRNYKNCGVYNSLTQYYIGNEVLNDGSSYRAKQDTLGNPPPLYPIIENDYWIMVASKGADGEGSGGSGTGDMLKSTYDPTNKQSDVFSMDNMVETSTKKIMTADERDKLGGIEIGANKYIHPETHSIVEVEGLQTALDDKVDKVDGKQLSTEDYTTDEKNKLSGIESGANKTTINDTLISTSTTEALSARQGKILNDKLANTVEISTIPPTNQTSLWIDMNA